MDIDVARYAARQSFKIARQLQDTLLVLKEKCDADEYKRCAVDIAMAVDAVSVALLNRAIQFHPNLEQEIDAQISAHGRYI